MVGINCCTQCAAANKIETERQARSDEIQVLRKLQAASKLPSLRLRPDPEPSAAPAGNVLGSPELKRGSSEERAAAFRECAAFGLYSP